MTSHHLRVERPSDGVALLVLDNPDQRNAMSDVMTEAWSAAVADLARRPHGAGGRGHG
jgi:enoyl-CoA hydratase/carnithine racemase